MISGFAVPACLLHSTLSAHPLPQVPPNWLKACGQIGPTGTYNRKNLSAWYADLQLRWQQLEEWSAPSKPVEQLPSSVWISGCFNPMGFVTASMQVSTPILQFEEMLRSLGSVEGVKSVFVWDCFLLS